MKSIILKNILSILSIIVCNSVFLFFLVPPPQSELTDRFVFGSGFWLIGMAFVFITILINLAISKNIICSLIASLYAVSIILSIYITTMCVDL